MSLVREGAFNARFYKLAISNKEKIKTSLVKNAYRMLVNFEVTLDKTMKACIIIMIITVVTTTTALINIIIIIFIIKTMSGIIVLQAAPHSAFTDVAVGRDGINSLFSDEAFYLK